MAQALLQGHQSPDMDIAVLKWVDALKLIVKIGYIFNHYGFKTFIPQKQVLSALRSCIRRPYWPFCLLYLHWSIYARHIKKGRKSIAKLRRLFIHYALCFCILSLKLHQCLAVNAQCDLYVVVGFVFSEKTEQ